MYFAFITVVLLLCCVCLYFYYSFHITQCREQSVIPDIYFERWNKDDLVVRGCRSIDSCKINYAKSLRDPTNRENRILHIECKKVDDAIVDIFPLLFKIPWKIKIFNGAHMENGHPHTHKQFILFPESMVREGIYSTLLHEKVHLFQRKYPIETNKLITHYMGFNIYLPRYKRQDSLRSNPDINQIIYTYPKSDNMLLPKYKTNPEALIDIEDMNDHPFEIMAYSIQEMIFPSKSLRYQHHHQQIHQWLKTLNL